MKFLNWVFRNFSTPEVEPMESIQDLAHLNAINRRQNTRVKYPHTGPAGRLPAVYFKNKEVQVADISVGGLCVVDPLQSFVQNVGEEFEVEIAWSDWRKTQKATLVGVNMDNRHVQFLEPDPEIIVRLHLILRPGYTGQRFHRVTITKDSPVHLSADEMWVGPTGESLVFYAPEESTEVLGTMRFQGFDIQLLKHSIPVYAKKEKDWQPGQRLHPDHLKDLLIVLANFKNPTERVLTLVDFLYPYIENLKSSSGEAA